MDFTRNLTKPIICYIKEICNTIDRIQYEVSKIVGLITYTGIGTLKNPVNNIYTKRIKIGENSIRIDNNEINFDNSGRKITSTEIGTQDKPFETIYVKKIDADNEIDNFTVEGYLTVKGETTLGTDTTTDTTVKGDLIVEGTSSLEGTVTLGTDITTDTTVKGDLIVEGTQTIFTSTLTPSDPSDPTDNGAVIIKGGTIIEKDLFVDGTIYGATDGKIETESLVLPQTLEVEGQTTLKGGVDLGSTSSITNAVDIDGTGDLTMGTITMIGFRVDAIGDTSVSTFDSTGATSLATDGGAVNIASSGNTTTVKGSLNVDQAVTLDSTLGVTGNVTLGDPSNSSDLKVYGDLDVDGIIYPTSTIDFFNNTQQAGTIQASTLLINDVSTTGSTGITLKTTNESSSINLETTSGNGKGVHFNADGLNYGDIEEETGTNNFTLKAKVSDSSNRNIKLVPANDGNIILSTTTLGTTTVGGGNVDLSALGSTTTVKGSLNVDQAVTLDSTLGVTGNVSVGDSSNSSNLKVYGDLDVDGNLGFFSKVPVSQQNTTGTTTGFTENQDPSNIRLVDAASTFTGNSGTTAYTIGDIVLALKNYGLLQA